jgi:hypothetical protein
MSHLSPVTPGQSGAGTEPSRFLLGKTLAVYHRAHIGVVVHASVAPSAADWTAMLHAMDPRTRAILVLVPPGCPGPSAAQRKETADHWLGHGDMPPTAVVTDSRLHRGIITAINWLVGNGVKAYATPSPEARQHLDATVELWNAVLQQARDVGMQLGVAEALPYLAEPW